MGKLKILSVLGLAVMLLGCLASFSRADTYEFVNQWNAGNYPLGVAIDSTNGYVYVADTNNSWIRKYNLSGILVKYWGSAGAANGQFNKPSGVAVDSSGNVYVADTNNHRIQKFSADGAWALTIGGPGAGSSDGQFSSPYGVAINASGNIYVADTNNNRVQIFDSNGTFVSKFTGSGSDQMSIPKGIAVDSANYIFVADTGNHRIEEYDSSGASVNRWGSQGTNPGQFQSPWGITLDAGDNVFVADSGNNRIQKFDNSGVIISTTWDAGAGALNNPTGAAIDIIGTDIGNVYVMDNLNSRVVVFQPQPQITLVSPNGGETWGAGSQVTITWTYVGNPGSTVKIDLLKGGAWNRSISTSTSIGSLGSGSLLWTVPVSQEAGTDYTVRITSIADSQYWDESNGPFTIQAPGIAITVPGGTEIWPAGSQQTLRWSYTGNPGSYVSIELLQSGALNRTIAAATSIGSGGIGSLVWTIPATQVAGNDYTIRITSVGNSIYTVTSNVFSIAAPTITVKAPSGGVIWGAGAVATISWSTTGKPGTSARIELFKGTKLSRTIATAAGMGTGGIGSYKWTIPSSQTTGDDFTIRVTSTSNNNFFGESGIFSIEAPSISIGYPIGGEIIGAGIKVPISWTYIGNPGTSVSIELWKGDTKQKVLTKYASMGKNNMGVYNWLIPANQTQGSDYWIWIKSASAASWSNYFTILGPTITVTAPQSGQVYGAGDKAAISWAYTGGPGRTVRLELYRAGQFVRTIAGAVSIAGGSSYNAWVIPASLEADTTYQVKVGSTSNPSINGLSPYFEIKAPTITVASPDGGEVWATGTVAQIGWAYTGNPGSTVKIDLYKNGVFYRAIASRVTKGTGGNGVYNWSIPTSVETGADYKVVITSTTNPAYTDASNADFTIVPTQIFLVTPNGGENWQAGSTQQVQWAYYGEPGQSVKLQLLKAGIAVSTIVSSVSKGSGNVGTYNWTIPAGTTPGGDYQIKITSTSNSKYTDTSDAYFTISPP